MSFETAKTVTPETSFSNRFNFARRQQPSQHERREVRQSVNISRDTLAKAAMQALNSHWTPKLSYSPSGQIAKGRPVGQFLNAAA